MESNFSVTNISRVSPCRIEPGELNKESLPLFTVISAMLCCISTAINSFLLLVVYKDERLQTVSNLFICSLAVSDLVSGLLAIPVSAASGHLWIEDLLKETSLLTKTKTFFLYLTTSGSILNVCAVSVDRFIAIQWPMKYPFLLTRRKVALTVLFLWTFNLASSAPSFYVRQLESLPFLITRLIVLLLLPLAVIIFCYIKNCQNFKNTYTKPESAK